MSFHEFNRNSIEDFVETGHWWLPGKEQRKLYGNLQQSNQRLDLIIMDELNEATSAEDPFSFYRTILGTTTQGRCVTAVNCREWSSEQATGAHKVAIFKPEYVIVGPDFLDHQCVFPKGQVNFPLMEKLAGMIHFAQQDYAPERTPENESLHPPLTFAWSYEGVPKFDVKLDSIGASLKLLTDRVSRTSPNQLIEEIRLIFCFLPDNEKDPVWYLEQIRHFATLLSTLYGLPVPYRHIRLEKDYKNYTLLASQFYQTSWNDPAENLSAIMVSLRQLPSEYLKNILPIWFKLDNHTRLLVSLFIALSDQQYPYTYEHLVNQAQLLEAYSRHFDANSKYASGVEFSKIKDALIEAIPKSVASDHRSKITNTIEHLNEHSQRKRLISLMRSRTEDIKEFLCSKEKSIQDNFIERIVNTRNYIIHRDPENDDNIFGENELQLVNIGLRLWLYSMFAEIAKIPQEHVYKAMFHNQNGYFYRSVKKFLFDRNGEMPSE